MIATACEANYKNPVTAGPCELQTLPSTPVLTATLLNTNQVHVNWTTDDPPDGPGMTVLSFTTNGGDSLMSGPEGGDLFDEFWMFPWEAELTTYYYNVYGMNIYFESSDMDAPEANQTVRLDLFAPSAPSGMRYSNHIDLTWYDYSYHETHYIIERSDTPDWANKTPFTVAGNGDMQGSMQYSDTTALPNHTYYYRIRAYSSVEECYSLYSNPLQVPSL